MKRILIIFFICITWCNLQVFAEIHDEVEARREIVGRIVNENNLDSAILTRPYIAAYGGRNWTIVCKDSVGYTIYSIESIDAQKEVLHEIFIKDQIDTLEWFFNNDILFKISPELKHSKKFHMYDYYIVDNGLSQPFVFNVEDNYSDELYHGLNDLKDRLSMIIIWLSCPYLHNILNNPFIE